MKPIIKKNKNGFLREKKMKLHRLEEKKITTRRGDTKKDILLNRRIGSK